MIVTLPTLTLVLVAAIIGAFNPSAISVLILFISKLLGSGRSTRHLLVLGLCYALGLFVTYFIAGLFLFCVLASLPGTFTQLIAIAIALGIIILALLEIKDYFWYDRGFSLRVPTSLASKLQHWPMHRMNPFDALTVGAFAGVAELTCTSAPYLAVISLLRADLSWQSVGMLALYSAVFILPLIVILAIVAAGVRISTIQRRKEQNKPILRLSIGLLLVALGWLTLLIANGAIKLG
jgi:cytochrome c biogenesis protein CcdA